MQPRESWYAQALCTRVDPELFFPEKGANAIHAKKICETCPVTTQCLLFAIEHGMRYGIWGGMNTRERKTLRKTLAKTQSGEAIEKAVLRNAAIEARREGVRVLTGQGLNSRDIAERIGITPRSVVRYRSADRTAARAVQTAQAAQDASNKAEQNNPSQHSESEREISA